MQREIKFRGQRVDNSEWVFGLIDRKYTMRSNYTEIGFYINSEREGSVYEHEINSSTIGQYTGLKDKNGVDAYYDDIIQFVTTEGTVMVKELEWSEELCCLLVGGMPYEHLFSSGFIQPSKLVFTIIGTIHTHPLKQSI